MVSYVQLAYTRRLILGVERAETMFPSAFVDGNREEFHKPSTVLMLKWPEVCKMRYDNAWEIALNRPIPLKAISEMFPESDNTLYGLARQRIPAMCMKLLFEVSGWRDPVSIVRNILHVVVLQMEMGLEKTVLDLYDMGMLALRIASRAMHLHVKVAGRHADALKNLMSPDFVMASFDEIIDDPPSEVLCTVEGAFRGDIDEGAFRDEEDSRGLVTRMLRGVISVLTGSGSRWADDASFTLAEQRWIPDNDSDAMKAWMCHVELSDVRPLDPGPSSPYVYNFRLPDTEQFDTLCRGVEKVKLAWADREGSDFAPLAELLRRALTFHFSDIYLSLRRTPPVLKDRDFPQYALIGEESGAKFPARRLRVYQMMFSVRAIWRSNEYEGVIRRVESDDKEASSRKRVKQYTQEL